MSSSMPPPSGPFAHRRTRTNFNNSSSLQPPHPPLSPSCVPRKMSVAKGASFHVSSSPPTEDDPVLNIPFLPRRSPTSSQASLMNLIIDTRDLVDQSVRDFNNGFSGARGKTSSPTRQLLGDLERQLRRSKRLSASKRAASPADSGYGSVITASSDKGLDHSLTRTSSRDDSAIGSSIKSEGVAAGQDNVSEQDVIEDETNSALEPSRTRQPGSQSHSSPRSSQSAVTQSIAPRHNHQLPHLGPSARETLKNSILDPILQEKRFELFHPLVASLDPNLNKGIENLRDLEHSLLHHPQPPSVTQQLYRTFGEFSVQLVLDTYQHLAESEQRRATDRPYDSGYFLDLVRQVGHIAAQVGRRREAIVNGQEPDSTEEEDQDYSLDDEVTLEGGLAETGGFAELVRWKNGKGISLRTMQPYEPLIGVKRRNSGEVLDDEVERSMARRKKGEIPKIVEMKCADPTCDKIFTRKCDLAKHEKTHSRPFKCPEKSCKYHHEGLPTEKELQRHVNDKHDPNPAYFHCSYCLFKTKRESNCKQHMEKKHGWKYDRVKGSSKAVRTPGQTPQTPSVDYTPSPAPSANTNVWETSSPANSDYNLSRGSTTPFDQGPTLDFNTLPGPQYNATLFPHQPSAFVEVEPDFGFETTMQAPARSSYGRHPAPIMTHPVPTTFGESPITPAHSNITSNQESPVMHRMDVRLDYTSPDTYAGLPTPESHLQPHSRNPSMSNHSPMDMAPFDQDQMLMSGLSNDMNHDLFISHSQLPAANDTPFFLEEGGPSDYLSHAGPSSYVRQSSYFPDVDMHQDFFQATSNSYGQNDSDIFQDYFNFDGTQDQMHQ